ncbi:radical SAM family heme chaperone HemW [Siphonobacter sp. SORGH_AS_0500]|uniref:radical SAM family heme chaperone HemW n=1 Tax=Siphonobacter sp. SORGH_AS_0500 TaxID=1864824 RepID=UPI00285BD573|nr:radical SAM family heme chaperone HemW [Siphonobacter sp. SORGH_AS_0500]MDR6196556.1 oxygen-independent coproporphyrinogen-3 oxidase [Siphonobacter sp. SORGH_AS_0500]
MHLYLHIPFCRQACYYCDFHFSTSLNGRTDMVEAISREIVLRRNYLPSPQLDTIYFGGGTPSLLEEADFQQIFRTIHEQFSVNPAAEITLEANPDDLSLEKLRIFKRVGINRLSIGIQSFHEPHLKHLHRIHSAEEAQHCVRMAQDVGFENITIDLIYAIPSSEADPHAIWRSDLAKAMDLNVPHISAYCLTIEPQTVFGKWLKSKRIAPIDDSFAAEQFQILLETLRKHGYEQYEISNFARPGRHSQHNSSYWLQHPYLGVGPSAHSYDGQQSRQHNLSHNTQYVSAIQREQIPAEIEELSEQDLINEYVLTSLRTHWGTSLKRMRELSSAGFSFMETVLPELKAKGWIREEESMIYLTEAGKLFADRVAEELFWV